MYFLCAIFLLATASPPEAKILALNSDIDSFLASNLTVFNANKPRVSQTPIRARRKRYITQIDMVEILDYHNQVRANVFPPAANMEYMVRKSIYTFRVYRSELTNGHNMLQHLNNFYYRFCEKRTIQLYTIIHNLTTGWQHRTSWLFHVVQDRNFASRAFVCQKFCRQSGELLLCLDLH